MLAEQRAEAILTELAQRRAVSVAELCQVTGASEATIRRDLNTLASQGRLSKVHGGAVQLNSEFLSQEPEMSVKRGLHIPEKERIARYAAALIEDDDVVFLDGGSTVMRMTEHLKPTSALFVTNGMECAFWLLERELRVYVIGGALKRDTASAAGAEAMDSLRRYHFTKAFLGAGGVTAREGFTVADPEDAAVKALAASRARQAYMLVDSSKFGRIGAAAVLPIDEAAIITDRAPGREFQDCAEVTVV